MKTIAPVERLISCLNRLPGIGRRSAGRIAYELVTRRDSLLQDLTAALQDAARNTVICSQCGGITSSDRNPCFYCSDDSRSSSILCVVETPMDLLIVESTGSYSGRYHVLGGKLSPMRGNGIDNLKIESLLRRIKNESVKEVILALNSDVESDATASLLKEMMSDMDVSVSRPAMGLPAGSGIAYIDRLTLNRAIEHREILQGAKIPEKSE